MSSLKYYNRAAVPVPFGSAFPYVFKNATAIVIVIHQFKRYKGIEIGYSLKRKKWFFKTEQDKQKHAYTMRALLSIGVYMIVDTHGEVRGQPQCLSFLVGAMASLFLFYLH